MHGHFTGTYFSAELQAAKDLGYKIKVIKALEFSKRKIFNEYIQHFYDKKKNSAGAERFIAKMHLNQLYGIFGRKLINMNTIIIHSSDLKKYLATYIIKNVIKINEHILALVVYSNLNNNICKELNLILEKDIKPDSRIINTNVSIASAVTAYARVHMSQYKNKDNIDLYYTDTDSIFTGGPLPPSLISKELGFMKDELNGSVINEAYFLGIKQYGYTYSNVHALDTTGIIEKSV